MQIVWEHLFALAMNTLIWTAYTGTQRYKETRTLIRNTLSDDVINILHQNIPLFIQDIPYRKH